MTNTAHPASGTAPVDITTMRATIGRLLPPDVEPLARAELDTVITLLRGQIQLMVPEVHAAAVSRPKDDIYRCLALACIGEARGRLGRIPAGPGKHDALMYARRLARVLNALCDHHETLHSER